MEEVSTDWLRIYVYIPNHPSSVEPRHSKSNYSNTVKTHKTLACVVGARFYTTASMSNASAKSKSWAALPRVGDLSRNYDSSNLAHAHKHSWSDF